MKINIRVFGQLSDSIGETLELDDITDTNSLTKVLNERYPELVDAKFVMAVNKKMVTENIVLTDDSTIALLPPFSGG